MTPAAVRGRHRARRRRLTAATASLAALLLTAGIVTGNLASPAPAQATSGASCVTPPPSPAPARFPGDPGAGRIVVGAIVSGGAGTADGFQQATGARLGAHRTYFHRGISDLAPGGPVLAYIHAEQAAGRVPVVSVKLDWAQTAAGTYDTQLRAFRDTVERLPGVVDLIVNHEPQNDGLGAALFVAEQRHIRAVIGSHLTRLSFGGSLMAYGWTAQGIAKFGPPDAWFPGPAVWDWAGLDQYAQKAGAPIDDAKFEAALISLKKWGVPPAVTELGIRVADPTGAAKLKAFFDKLVSLGFVSVTWFDSDNNSTGAGWVLTPGPLRDEFVAMLEDPRAVRPNA